MVQQPSLVRTLLFSPKPQLSLYTVVVMTIIPRTHSLKLIFRTGFTVSFVYCHSVFSPQSTRRLGLKVIVCVITDLDLSLTFPPYFQFTHIQSKSGYHFFPLNAPHKYASFTDYYHPLLQIGTVCLYYCSSNSFLNDHVHSIPYCQSNLPKFPL